MAFPKIVEDAAYSRCEGKFECHRPECGHPLPHGAPVTRREAHFRRRLVADGELADTLENCQVLCPYCFCAAGLQTGSSRETEASGSRSAAK